MFHDDFGLEIRERFFVERCKDPKEIRGRIVFFHNISCLQIFLKRRPLKKVSVQTCFFWDFMMGPTRSEHIKAEGT